MLRLGAIAFLLFAAVALQQVQCQGEIPEYKNPHFFPNRSVIVEMFEWKWNDIAEECERFLGPNGFGGVQISPPTENLIIRPGRPWWERYHVMSYIFETRSGTSRDLLGMFRRCNAARVRVYVDAVINHMTATWPFNKGTAGSDANFEEWEYPSVPYNKSDFNWPPCNITNMFDPDNVRNCEYMGLKDLNQTEERVIEKITGFMNDLIDMGAAGFRIDSAKFMHPNDLVRIYGRLANLVTEFGFPPRARPYLYQQVQDMRDGGIEREEYIGIGDVTEYLHVQAINDVIIRGNLSSLKTWGEERGFMNSRDALVFIDDHEMQRKEEPVLSYKHRRGYKLATAFMLAHPYGEPKIMSSYNYTNATHGPPMDARENILSPIITSDERCDGGWVCEHRWPQIYTMVAFRNLVANATLNDWWDNGVGQLSFCRGNKGFVAFNNEVVEMNRRLQTCLPSGIYCDIITGRPSGANCTGFVVEVDSEGFADITVESAAVYRESVLAIHIGPGSKLEDEYATDEIDYWNFY